jgi:hypothetical protein
LILCARFLSFRRALVLLELSPRRSLVLLELSDWNLLFLASSSARTSLSRSAGSAMASRRATVRGMKPCGLVGVARYSQ